MNALASSTGVLSQIRLTKHEGLGNDFLIAIDPPRPLTADDARSWCDRRRGIGADGLIALTGPESRPVMTLWNADGSRAEISGNGIRCAAQALARHRGLCEASFVIETDAGQRRLGLSPTDDPAIVEVRVDMGAARPGPGPSQRWGDAGVDVEMQTGVDLGNPHLVALVDDPARYDIGAVGPTIEAGYPGGLNVHLVSVLDRSTVRMKVWERGAGVTEACGSGACAAVVATAGWGLVDSPVTVRMPGGSVTVEAAETVHLTGPARFIGTVLIDTDSLDTDSLDTDSLDTDSLDTDRMGSDLPLGSGPRS